MDDLVGLLPFVIFVVVMVIRGIQSAKQKTQQQQMRARRKETRPASYTRGADAELREFLARVAGGGATRPTPTRPQPAQPVSPKPTTMRRPARDVSGDIERALGGAGKPAKKDLSAPLPSEAERREPTPAPERAKPTPTRRASRPRLRPARRARRPKPAPVKRTSSKVRRLVADAPVAATKEKAPAPRVESGVSSSLSQLNELQRAVVMAEILGKPVSMQEQMGTGWF